MSSLSDVRAYVELTRPQNVSGSVLTYCIGYFLLPSASLSWQFLAGLFIFVALHSFATVQNDVADFEIDKANKRKSVLQDGTLSMKNAHLFVWGLCLFAVLIAILSPDTKFNLAAIAGFLLLSMIYNLPPIQASKRPVLSIIIMALCFGALPFIYGYALANGDVSSTVIAMMICWFLARFSTTIMKDYKDTAGDKKYSKNTFYLRFGGRATGWTSIVLAAASYLGILTLLLRLQDQNAVFAITFSLVLLLALRSIFQRLQVVRLTNEDKLNKVFHQALLSHNQFEAAVLACLILS